MEIDYLREFLVLAETKNYWEASERLYIGQSTLSKHIRHMEEELGVPLFERTTRRVALTEYGEKMIPSARTIIEAQLDYMELIHAMKADKNGELILGVIPSMVQYKLTDLLLEYRKRWPDAPVRVLEGDTYDLKQALLDGRCQLAFLRESDSFPIDSEEFDKLPYMTDHAAVLLPENHPLASETEISLSQLKKEDFLMLQETSVLRTIFTDACMKAGFTPKIVFDSQRMDTIFHLVSQGLGISLIMNRHMDSTEGVRKIPLKPDLESRIFLCCLKNKKRNPAMKHMTGLTEELATASSFRREPSSLHR